jgi:DNA-directed RNA polymerase specialized sigma24 family protein
MLRPRATRREEPLVMHLPEPLISRADGGDPEQEALLADAVGLALLVVLETLTPAERPAFVLRDLFAVPFQEIVPMIERSPAAARQLASRAASSVNCLSPVTMRFGASSLYCSCRSRSKRVFSRSATVL